MGGVDFSNTYFFEKEMGWKGVLIEPNPFNFTLLQQNRPNNFLFNDVISNSKEKVIFRYFKDEMSGVSGVENTLPENHLRNFFDTEKYCFESLHDISNENCTCWWKKQQTQGRLTLIPRTLTSVLQSTGIKEFDFLSLDVEGHEFEVLESWDFSIPIKVILIEMLGLDKEKDEKCRQKLISQNYKLHSVYQHNEIYVVIE